MIKKIFKFFLWVFGIVGFLFLAFGVAIYIFIHALFSPPAGCDPSEPSDACDYINTNYESQFENTKANPFPQNLAPKPVFWENAFDGAFPDAISVPYIYLRDKHGVWLRYNDGLSFDYFLGEDMPEKHYLYIEDDFSPSEEVRKKEKFYSHKSWNITLKEGANEIYKQTAHKITRQYIGSFDLHSNPGRTVWFPSSAEQNFEAISKLQIPLEAYDFPPKLNINTEITPQKYGKFHGDSEVLPVDENVYEIKTAQGTQKIRTSNMSKWSVEYKKQKAICGDKFCLFLFTDTDKKNKYCENIGNETAIVFLNLERKFTSRSYSNSPLYNTNGYHFGLKEGYEIDDIASFEMIPSEFAEFEKKQQPDKMTYKNVPTGKKFIEYELKIYAKDGALINQYCDHYYMHEKIRELQ
ncbi:hypothetical protein OFO03_05640 [Campylobacter sp. JMF_02 ED1]|uniref:hypothetical protein n=1 Tax=unclassified Campylobacter TaxID=2593542 RepID=UPI0022E9B6B2|nr:MULTISPECIES: hypothetical protein [unclassified Campylobacter]MDA3049200.1 hypothetical protein [Campylobacter sp. JMF_15 NE4]MDA3051375.1 hypothetical protein [Campylobacter sp. JMF_02 ED1]